MGGRRDVGLDGGRHPGGSPASRRYHQTVQKIIPRSARLRSELLTIKGSLCCSNYLLTKPLSVAAAALQAAVQANHFGVMQVHNLKETMAKKGVEFAHECLIFEVCQPQQAKKVLDQNMSVSTALPCRISIFEEGGKTILATLKPTTLLAMFNEPQLKGVAQEVEDMIVKIMQEAASS